MRFLVAIILICMAVPSVAQDRLVRLYAPEALIETGLLKFALPRFSLKTQVKIEYLDTADTADFVFGSEGTAVFEGAGTVWAVTRLETPATTKLMDWIQSDVGRRTIFGYAPGGAQLFSAPQERAVEVAKVEIGEDAVLGKQVARAKCARCHAVDDQTRMTTIGSTPSFFVLRTFEDWDYRFSVFYVLKPHGAFTQIKDVTEPFPIDRPSPIAPVEMTTDELEAILAYIAILEPADLGAAIQSQ